MRTHTHSLFIYSKTSLNCNSSKSTISRHKKKKQYKTITWFSRKLELLNDSCCSVFFLLANTRVPSQNADFDDAEEEGYRFLRRLLAAGAKTLSLLTTTTSNARSNKLRTNQKHRSLKNHDKTLPARINSPLSSTPRFATKAPHNNNHEDHNDTKKKKKKKKNLLYHSPTKQKEIGGRQAVRQEAAYLILEHVQQRRFPRIVQT